MCRHAVPAIWLYPEDNCDIDLVLKFHGGGFMTASTPPYQAGWRIHVDPTIPFCRYRERYGAQSHHMYLDYDGVREGPFQTDAGWCVKNSDFIPWQRSLLTETGYKESEVDDALYVYGRLLMDLRWPQKYLAVYPQFAGIVDQSVSLEVVPTPATVYRLWFYIIPISEEISLSMPSIPCIHRKGFTLVELGYLTNHDMDPLPDPARTGHRVVSGLVSPWVRQIQKQFAAGQFR